MLGELQKEHHQRRRNLEIAQKETNIRLMKEKYDKDNSRKHTSDTSRLNHIEYNTGHDFYTENTATCQSQLAKHRVIPYHWKGMNESQKEEILLERANQVQERKMLENLSKEEERMYAR